MCVFPFCQLYAVQVYPDGKMSQYFASLKPGDVVEVKGYYDMKILLGFYTCCCLLSLKLFMILLGPLKSSDTTRT
jgi:hypothetical protein